MPNVLEITLFGAPRVTRRRSNSRRRSVFVVTIPPPRPSRAVQRARLWAITVRIVRLQALPALNSGRLA